MKKSKRTLAFMLAMLLTSVFCMVAFAAPVDTQSGENKTAKIEVYNSVENQLYNAYKIFDVTQNGSAYAYTMELDNEWLDVVQPWAESDSSRGITFTYTTHGNYSVTFDNSKYTDAVARALANHLNANKDGKTPTGSGRGTGSATTPVTITNDKLTPGYYFVTSALGSLCMLQTASDTAVINEKNTAPTITKTADKTSAKIGDEITFTLGITAGGNALTDYVIHDTMTDGLSLVGGSDGFAITYTNDRGEDITISKAGYDIDLAPTDGCTFDIKLKSSLTSRFSKGRAIKIIYKATLNTNALKDHKEINTAKLQYGDTTSSPVTAEVYTYGFGLAKTDNEDNILSGASFKLYTDSACQNEIQVIKIKDTATNTEYYRPALTGETPEDIVAGNVVIDGLANGTYYLKEIEAPDGYNPLATTASITIEGADRFVTLEGDKYKEGGLRVINYTGAVIPGTGGIGTTIFYVLGSILLLGAGIILVSKRRMNNTK